ncbi:MAG: enoyl-CoA hydratase/isomerase family protein, partial [Pseudomonadota bacterium]
KTIKVFDRASLQYRLPTQASSENESLFSEALLSLLKNPNRSEQFAQLHASDDPHAQFLWSIFRDVFHYVAVHLGSIANTVRDVDCALRWGFGWTQGPFEHWQAAGWQTIAEAIKADIAAGKSMSSAPLPDWVFQQTEVYNAAGAYSAQTGTYQTRHALPVYARQFFPERMPGESPIEGVTLWENEGLRLWILPQFDASIGILSITTKLHTLGTVVTSGLPSALSYAEQKLKAVVIWHEAPFSVGANLKEVDGAIKAGEFDLLTQQVAAFQQTTLALKYASIPVVAAVQGMALGGGCEFLLHARHRVLALESYIGLVEASVGLLPAGGGCKELAIRAWQSAERTTNKDPFAFIQPLFLNIAQASVSSSAQHAKTLGFAYDSDTVVLNAHELLYVALHEARALGEGRYYPSTGQTKPGRIKVAGRNGIANCEMILANMQGGGMISAHDYAIAKAIATALCGGDIETGSEVDETWLLSVERQLFIELLKTEKTQQRITHMLATGKALRN